MAEPEEYTVPAAGSEVGGEDRVYVMLPNGQTGTMTRDAAGVAIANGQAFPVQPNEKVTSMERRAVIGEEMGATGAALRGGAMGLTMGLAPFVQTPQQREEMQVASEDFGGAFETGNIAGSVAGMFMGPGRLAVGAGRAATGAFGARTALGRIGARALGEGLEGGIIGAAETAGRLRMRDDPVDAGKVMSGFGLAALIGGAMGAPAAGIGEMSSFARRGLRRMSGPTDLDAAQRAMYGDVMPGASKMASDLAAPDTAYRGKPLDPQDASVLGREMAENIGDLPDSDLEKLTGKQIFDRLPEANQGRLRMIAAANPNVKNAYELIDAAKTRARREMLLEGNQQAAMERMSSALAAEAKAFNDGGPAFHDALSGSKPKWLGKFLDSTPGTAKADQITHARMLIAKSRQELSAMARPSKEEARRMLLNQPGVDPADINAGMVKQLRDQMEQDRVLQFGQGAPREARKLLDIVDAADRALNVDGLSQRAVFENLDKLKKHFQPFARPDVPTTNRFVQTARGMYNDDFLKALEDPDLWGPRAARAQARINKAAHEEMMAQKAAGDMFRKTGEAESIYGDFVQKNMLDTEWIVTQLNKLEKPGADQSWQAFRNFVNKRQSSMKAALDELDDLDPVLRSRLENSLNSANKLQSVLDEAEKTVTEINRAKRLAGAQRSGLEMAIVLGLVGGLPGFAAGRLAMGAQNVGPVMRYMASLERAAHASDGRLAQSMQKFFENNWRKALGLTPRKADVAKAATGDRVTGIAKALDRGLGKAERGAETARRAAKGAFYSQIRPGENKREAYAKRVRELSAVASDPVGTEAHVMATLGPLAEDMPQTRMAMSQGLSDGARAILDRMPSKDFAGEYLMGDVDEVPVSDMEIDDFARMYDVYADPVSAMERFAEGKITPQEVDVLEATAPALFQRIQQRVMETIAQDPKAITYEKRLTLGILLKVPTDASLNPRYVYTQQSLFHASRLDYAQGTEQGQRRTYNETGVHLSDDLKTPSQKLQLGFDR